MRRWLFGGAAALAVVVLAVVLVATRWNDESANPWEGVTGHDLSTDPPGFQISTCADWATRNVTQDEVEWGCSDGSAENNLDGPLGIYRCDDGRILYSLSGGWGYVGEPMRPPNGDAVDDIVPPSEMADCGERLYPDPTT